MEITYKITEQEMVEILSKELGTPVGSVIRDTDGNFIAKVIQGNTVPKENISEMDTIIEYFTENFGQEKTERILSFFDSFFDGLEEMQSIKSPGSIFFYKKEGDKKVIWMEQDLKNGYLWCEYSGFWSILEKDIGLEHIESRYVIYAMMEHHLRRVGETSKVKRTKTIGVNIPRPYYSGWNTLC